MIAFVFAGVKSFHFCPKTMDYKSVRGLIFESSRKVLRKVYYYTVLKGTKIEI